MTDIPLRDYMERVLSDRQAAHEALDKEFHDNIKERLEEIASTLREIQRAQSDYVLNATYTAGHEALRQRVEMLETFKAKAIGIGAVLVLVSGFIGAAVGKAFGF